MAFKVWVDADGCPKPAKEILFRAADRTGIKVTLVANHMLWVPPSPNIEFVNVGAGFDVADDRIAELLEAGDLVVTSDIPLAADVLELGALALTPRGEPFDPETIKQRLTMRDFMETMRGSGVVSGGPSAYDARDKQAFANALDRILTRATAAR